ncbi:TVP38/TMEM64 family protein [Oceanobacillus halophilus]|uniref:TVP38/TMEM64 family membrane protein n=1 Tax=Oceanobacillus halophilus TaxID=930130 RepID=A0A494ZUE8_9BACI|nr:VTT domain-containing protein [Oceanobacillus halophilus]RKQ29926.1 TVP38/TMEM64 family protein [Oceanobacillus halophilus]
MEYVGNYIMAFIEMGGLLSPLLFICFHLIRPLFFLPVIFICISGGILYGPVAGTIYSIIGITLSSVIFYSLVNRMPKKLERLVQLKQKLLGKHAELNTLQISVLRLVPFIHFHLLSLCLIEISAGFKDYTKTSFISNVPLALIYTSIGGWISNLSPIHIFIFLIGLLPLIYLLRSKEIIIKWREFFQLST